jgi:uncharacterized membrane protein YkvA (DUF1232 family)
MTGEYAVEEKLIEEDNATHLKTAGSSPSTPNSEEAPPQPPTAMSWKQQAQRLQKEAQLFYFIFKHPRTPWYARLVAACAASYVLSPIQLIPNFIPVIGTLDDFLVLFLGAKLLQKITQADVLAECRARADAAEIRRKEELRWPAAVAVPAVIVTVWFLAAIYASAMIAKYIRH